MNSAGWNCDLYAAQNATYWLYVIEYANLNCQLDFNAQPTSEGYKQGGLGAGVTTLNSTKWNTFNSYYPFVPCGTTNSLGNASGVVEYTMPDEYDTGVVTKVKVPSYRGIETRSGMFGVGRTDANAPLNQTRTAASVLSILAITRRTTKIQTMTIT